MREAHHQAWGHGQPHSLPTAGCIPSGAVGQSPPPIPGKRLPGSLTYQAAELSCLCVHEFIYYEQKCPEDWAQLCKSSPHQPKGGQLSHLFFQRR